ncbi:MAG: indolepyruvate oxidoreductase subunit beta [Deltaproteobacteria bacterium]|nr:indolepyruvate oxidoreductase subunit beta [Deltaproteobacteria bacterium]
MNDIGKSIMLVGVGGQGIIRASDILSSVIMDAGYDVKKSEVHGMAQRGGCVSSHVRYADKVFSPLAMKGGVDLLISFEKLETLRYLDYLISNGKIIINNEEIYPPSVNMGEGEYPSDVVETIRKYFHDITVVEASVLAEKAGDMRMTNTVMLGALSVHMSIDQALWEEVLKRTFSGRMAKMNLSAFSMGRNIQGTEI